MLYFKKVIQKNLLSGSKKNKGMNFGENNVSLSRDFYCHLTKFLGKTASFTINRDTDMN